MNGNELTFRKAKVIAKGIPGPLFLKAISGQCNDFAEDCSIMLR
jgi:hypothetical protein